MNIVKTGRGRFVELQGTAEHEPFDDDEMQADGRGRQGHPGAPRPAEEGPGRLRAEGSLRPARNSRSRANAFPRWLTRSLSSRGTSPKVFPKGG